MDEGIVHLLGPHEDEFALLLLGEPSLYRCFFDPGRFEEIADTCLCNENTTFPRWISFVTALSASKAPLLLKSPNHVFRLNAIARRWPDARTVWICRPFAEVLASNLRMWRAMIHVHHLRDGQVDLHAFLERVAIRYRDVVAGLIDAPKRPMLWLDYADLTAAPHAAAAAAATFLRFVPRATPVVGIDSRVHPRRTAPQIALPDARLGALAAEIDQLHAIATTRWGRKK